MNNDVRAHVVVLDVDHHEQFVQPPQKAQFV